MNKLKNKSNETSLNKETVRTILLLLVLALVIVGVIANPGVKAKFLEAAESSSQARIANCDFEIRNMSGDRDITLSKDSPEASLSFDLVSDWEVTRTLKITAESETDLTDIAELKIARQVGSEELSYQLFDGEGTSFYKNYPLEAGSSVDKIFIKVSLKDGVTENADINIHLSADMVQTRGED